MVIKGTIYQIALHEGDDDLIDNMIKPAFKKLHHGLEEMKKQRKAWLPDGWMEDEKKACANTLTAIDNLFTAFRTASHPNDVTESEQQPYTININDKNAKTALEFARKAIDSLCQSTDKVITTGRDPSIRLLEHVVDQFNKNSPYAFWLGNRPRNNTLLRFLYGYSQRFAPINFMQAFAQGLHYYCRDNKQSLTRSFKHASDDADHVIFPLDSDPLFRLGNEYFADFCGKRATKDTTFGFTKPFINHKQQLYKPHAAQNPDWKRWCTIV